MSKSDFELPPLPPDITALLAAEKETPGPTAKAQTRMLGAICTTLGLPVPLGPGPGPSGGGDGGTTGGGLGPGASGTAGGRGLGAAMASAVKPATLIAFALGAATGVGTMAIVEGRRHNAPAPEVRQHTPEKSHTTRPPSPSSPQAATLPERNVLGERPGSKPIIRPSLPKSGGSGGKEMEKGAASLAAERNLIEMARASLARGRPDDALRALERHRWNFQRGHFTEEREAVWVLALVAKGNLTAAQTGATDFAKKYPASLLRAVIEEAIRMANEVQ